MSEIPMNTEKNWEAYNDFLLSGTLDRFTKILARYELFRLVCNLPGDIVEAGVFKGTGVLYWAKLLQIFNPLSIRRVVGFDTFEGYVSKNNLDSERTAADAFVCEAAYVPVTAQEIFESARIQGLGHRVELVVGDGTKTIPEYVRRNPGFRIALLNLDFDVYTATKTALEELYNRVVPGGVIAFDEYASRLWGESNAADEFFSTRKIQYRTLPWAKSPSAYLIKE